jgi:protein-disulfide isomerase
MYLGKLEQKPVKVAPMSTVEDDEQDLTRKQRREQARAKRRELEQAEAADAKRRARLTQLGIVVAIVAAIIVGIVLATGGGSSKTGIPKNTSQVNATVAEVTSLLGGIPQSGNTLGNPKAPVTLQYFGDLECPICKEFTLGALAPLIHSYVRSGKLKIEYRAFQTSTREPETFQTQQVAALAAGKQGKMWDFVELFYREQGRENTAYVTERYLETLAQQVPGLNLPNWSAARSDPELANTVTSDVQAANNAGFPGTPSFLIGKTGGAMAKFEYGSLTDPSSFNSAIEKLLKA